MNLDILNRRSLLAGEAAVVTGAPLPLRGYAKFGRGFRHRGYLGWTTDLATEPDRFAEWPSMRAPIPRVARADLGRYSADFGRDDGTKED